MKWLLTLIVALSLAGCGTDDLTAARETCSAHNGIRARSDTELICNDGAWYYATNAWPDGTDWNIYGQVKAGR